MMNQTDKFARILMTCHENKDEQKEKMYNRCDTLTSYLCNYLIISLTLDLNSLFSADSCASCMHLEKGCRIFFHSCVSDQ